MRFVVPAVFVFASAAIFAACGDSGSPDTREEATTVSPTATITPTTPVPAPPWVTSSPTVPTGTTQVVEEATATATRPAATATVPPATNTPVPPTATPTTAPPLPLSASVTIEDDVRFVPNRLTIPVGSTINFAWAGAEMHNVAIPALGAASAPGKTGEFSYTFTAAGTYQWLCEIHRTTMKGLVTVTN